MEGFKSVMELFESVMEAFKSVMEEFELRMEVSRSVMDESDSREFRQILTLRKLFGKSLWVRIVRIWMKVIECSRCSRKHSGEAQRDWCTGRKLEMMENGQVIRTRMEMDSPE